MLFEPLTVLQNKQWPCGQDADKCFHDCFRFMLYAELHFGPFVAERPVISLQIPEANVCKSLHRGKCCPCSPRVSEQFCRRHSFLIHQWYQHSFNRMSKVFFGHCFYKINSDRVVFMISPDSCWQSHVCYRSISASHGTFLQQDVKCAL